MASIRRRFSQSTAWSSSCALGIAGLLLGPTAACNELFGIDEPSHAAGQAGGGGLGPTAGGTAGATAGAASGGKGGKGSGGAGGAGGGTGGASGEGGMPDVGGTGGGTGGDSAGTGGSMAGVGGAAAGTGGDAGMSATGGTGGVSGTAGDAGSAGTAGSAGAPFGLCDDPNLHVHGEQLVLIPAGTLMIGTEPGDLPNTQPVHAVTFAEFCIDRTEVTVTSYAECVNEGGCQEPETVGFSGCNWEVAGRDNHPVTCVDHARADTYCAWAHKRLPTEKEWEYAARGSEGRLYPWGNADPDQSLLNFGNVVNETTPVGSYPNGATPDTNLLDMAGNVWEWTASEWTEDYDPTTAVVPGSFIARGGSFASGIADYVRSSWRDPDSAGDERFGFRCAYGDGEP